MPTICRPGFAALLILLTGCAPSLHSTAPIEPGDYVQRLSRRAGGFRRSYHVHVPSGPNRETRLPVVVVLHGAFSRAQGIAARSGFSRLADQEGFVAVYPNGYGFFDLFRHWNAGHCCGRAQATGTDDVSFLDEVIDEIERLLRTDPTRVYVVGESNGAMLAYRYAAERAPRIAGAAAVIGTIGSRPAGGETEWRIPAPAVPVPMVIIHGGDDPTIPFAGGGHDKVFWTSVPESAAFWVGHNGASVPPSVERLCAGRVIRSTWSAAEGSAPVVLYEITDWGHEWPGPQSFGSQRSANPPCAFDAATAIWEQLQSHRREPGLE